TRTEQQQREDEQTYSRTDHRQRKSQAEPQRGACGHAAAAETTDQPSCQGQCQYGANRHREQDEAKLPITEGVAGFDRGDMWDPAGEHYTVEEEDGRERAARA